MWHKLTDVCAEQNKICHIVLVHQSSVFFSFFSLLLRNAILGRKREGICLWVFCLENVTCRKNMFVNSSMVFSHMLMIGGCS